MKWALLPTSWSTNKYNRHIQDNFTQKQKTRFHNLINTSDKHKPLLNNLEPNNIQLPFIKLFKVHKLSSSTSPNLDKLTSQPIITAHSSTTSNICKYSELNLTI